MHSCAHGEYPYPTRPDNLFTLVEYLRHHPILDVKFPTKETTYVFQQYDGLRLVFRAPGGDVILPCSDYWEGKMEYNEDCFTRTIGALVGRYYYTGPKRWQKVKPEQENVKDWDKVFNGLNLFVGV